MWRENKRHNKRVDRMISDRYISNDRRIKTPEMNVKHSQSLIRIIGKKAKKYIDDNKNSTQDNKDYLVPWTYDPNIKIDRFDARAFLDLFSIPKSAPFNLIDIINDDNIEKRNKLNQLCNFERFQTLIQLKILNIPEETYIKQISKFHTSTKTTDFDNRVKYKSKTNVTLPSATIEYRYEDSQIVPGKEEKKPACEPNNHLINPSLTDIPIVVNSMSDERKKEINRFAAKFGIGSTPFTELLLKDHERNKLSEEILDGDATIWNNMKNKEDVGQLREKQKSNQRRITQYYDSDIELEIERPTSILQEEINKNLKECQQRQLQHQTSYKSDQSEDSPTHSDKVEYISEFNFQTSTKRKRKSRFDQPPAPVISPQHISPKTEPKRAESVSSKKAVPVPAPAKSDKKLTPRELLKLRTQNLIEKQLKLDQSKKH